MPAHDDDGLAHEEHEEAGEQGEDEDGDAEGGYLSGEAELVGGEFVDEDLHEGVESAGVRGNGFTELPLEHIEDKAGDLRGEDGEVIGEDDKDDAKDEPEAVFPQVFVQRAQVFHWCEGSER